MTGEDRKNVPVSLTFSPLLPFNPLTPSAPCQTEEGRKTAGEQGNQMNNT